MAKQPIEILHPHPDSNAESERGVARTYYPARYISDLDVESRIPVHVVWELTLACNLACSHCGSRAGRRRPQELTTEECLDVVEQLAALGTREISLIGGEAYLRADWLDVVRAIRRNGMRCVLQTGGRALTRRRLAAAAEAGLQGVGVSLDGVRERHDELRGVVGSYASAIDVLNSAASLGLPTSVNTAVGSSTLGQLDDMFTILVDLGVRRWKIHLMVPMGNAVERDDLLLQPFQLLELMPKLAKLYLKGTGYGLALCAGNNLGYFGPYEHLWRSGRDSRDHWSGCGAGQTGLGLESNGTIKGCPSLATKDYGSGNVRDAKIEALWRDSNRIAFADKRGGPQLSGHCAECYYAPICDGGCTWTAHSLMGSAGDNPYCHYRALTLRAKGRQERIVKIGAAEDAPFATGHFELIEEAATLSKDGAPKLRHFPELSDIPSELLSSQLEVSPALVLCKGCYSYVYPGTTVCPFCTKHIASAERANAEEANKRNQLLNELELLINKEIADPRE